jgi:diguanylate cyclase (GGDEF)-like protein
MEDQMNPVEAIRHEEMKKTVRVGFVAKAINKFYISLGDYLYRKGFVSEIADSDSLTGFFNKNFFDRWTPKVLSQANRSGTTLSFVYMDMNDLKKVNDTLGHKEGDKMLRIFARAVTKGFRLSDLIFRLGGDEFLAVLWSCNKEVAEKKTKKIQDKLAKKKNIHFSFGVAESKGKPRLEEIVQEADRLMYEMKREMKGKRNVR